MRTKSLLLLGAIHMWVIFGSLYIARLSVAWTILQLILVVLPSSLLSNQTSDANGRPIVPYKKEKHPGKIVLDVPWHISRRAWKRTAALPPMAMITSVFISIYGPGIGLVTRWQQVFVLFNISIAWIIYMIYKSREWPDEEPKDTPPNESK